MLIAAFLSVAVAGNDDVSRLEAQFEARLARLEALPALVATLQAEAARLEALPAQVASLQAEAAGLRERIASLEGENDALKRAAARQTASVAVLGESALERRQLSHSSSSSTCCRWTPTGTCSSYDRACTYAAMMLKLWAGRPA